MHAASTATLATSRAQHPDAVLADIMRDLDKEIHREGHEQL
jgi:hypothetical protein